VFIDLSGWSPRYFPKQIIHYANTQLRKKMLFGSDFPLITPDKWMADAKEVGFRDEVMPGILKGNAAKLLGLA
jgi:predicted TIM-barrel fold metal-dependent hydrolase